MHGSRALKNYIAMNYHPLLISQSLCPKWRCLSKWVLFQVSNFFRSHMRVVLHMWPRGLWKNELGFQWWWLAVQRPWPREIHIIFLKALVMRCSVNLDPNVVFFLFKLYNATNDFSFVFIFWHGHPHFPLRHLIWILSSQNLGDHQTLSIFERIGFHVTFSFILLTCFPVVTSLTLYNSKRDHHATNESF